LEGVIGVSIEVKSKLSLGDPYRSIKKVVPMKTEEPVDIEHKKGEVWLVDFWATWCGYCHAPIKHNADMVSRRGAEWGSKVRFVCISKDKTKEPVKGFIWLKKLEALEHYMIDKSDCGTVYEVKGIPHVILIDKEGKIAFSGHPS
jgi:thiol-disulfide isomerase/thioredoxin